jgi:hypothetical protein
MCSKQSYSEHYDFTSSYTKTYVGVVCKSCCIREYYGTRGKTGKLYPKDMESKSLFGLK